MGSGSSKRVVEEQAKGKYNMKTTAEDISKEFGRSASGKTVIVTGASSGVGFETARQLAKSNAEVILACRTIERAEETMKKILKEQPKAKLVGMQIDLSSMESIWNFCTNFRRSGRLLHIIVNCASTTICTRNTTADNFESQLAVNHLGHFVLSLELLDIMIYSSSVAMPGRIINVSCFTNYLFAPNEGIHLDDLSAMNSYDKYERHGSSKLANLMFTRELARRVQEKRMPIMVMSLHPGLIANSKLFKQLRTYSMLTSSCSGRRGGTISTLFHEPKKTVEQGAATILYCVLTSEPLVNGGHYANCKEDKEFVHPIARNEVKLKDFWKMCIQLTGARDIC